MIKNLRLLWISFIVFGLMGFGPVWGLEATTVPAGHRVYLVMPLAEGIVYTTEKDGQSFVFTPKGDFGPFTYVARHEFCRSADGKNFAFVGHLKEADIVYVDGSASAPLGKVGRIAWPSDATQPLYSFSNAGAWFISSAGQTFGPFKEAKAQGDRTSLSIAGVKGFESLVFFGAASVPLKGRVQGILSPKNGGEPAIVFDDPQRRFYVQSHGEQYGPYASASLLTVSDNGLGVSYRVLMGGAPDYPSKVFANGMPLFDLGSSYLPPRWNASGTVPGWIAPLEAGVSVHAGDRVWGPFEDSYGLAWSALGHIAFNARVNGQWFVHDGEQVYGPYVDKGFNLVYSPDGTQLAYHVFEKGKSTVYINGVRFGSFVGRPQDLAFLPDGRPVFWESMGNVALHVGATKYTGFTQMNIPYWSLDGRAVAADDVRYKEKGLSVDYTKVFLNGKIYTGGIWKNRVVFLDGLEFKDDPLR